MIPLEALLAPIRDDAPCGDDPSVTGVLFELETMATGKPETQFSAAEEPDWKALKARALEVAKTTKDLRVASIFAATLLRTDGLEGFREGVQLARGYVEKYWESVFPLLDASDNNDPAERLNALSNLAAPIGVDGDLLRVIPGLRKTPVLSAPRAGRFGLEHFLVIRGKLNWAGPGGAPTQALLEAAQQELGADAGAAAVTAQQIIDELTAIENIFKERSGPSSFPSFEPLRADLKQIVAWLGVAADAPAEAGGNGSGAAGGGGGGPAGGGGPSFSGGVQSRTDVVRALDAIITYYQHAEPSSPVPFLLKRVKRIVPMNFLELMNELTPEAREKILALIGSVEEATPNA